ncbi:tyrosine-type recombinase/integrase [Streptomyces alkaliphilus]|uniref:Tyrosine-type recombinase/integrase n=1 Tax=Streptomyces alkaliphilus TaxID=1472722 RepID=A0A7W3XZU3_9ACTN|nr:tyrosine-type recombinase/integrase [Streptomyces alkaliphilus]MBB0242636.1 tyrosine-type recombinase/integrase [Streptomyces alkaliphilus]
MKKGSTSRRCSCRNPATGTAYGTGCPKLSNRRHGAWSVLQELEPRQDGTRRRFRRSGFATAAQATDVLNKVRALMAIPEKDDRTGQLAISDLLEECAAANEPLPDYDETRRRFRVGEPLDPKTTVEEWLKEWLAGKKRLRPNGVKRYEVDIRVHLKPHLGHLRLDKLRVAHISRMFEAINEANIEITEQNAQRRAAVDELKSIPFKGAENRLRRQHLKAAIDRMPPFRRPTGLNTQPHIKATLRAALNVAIAQQRMPNFNPAEHVELLPGAKPKALIWTDERIARWEATGEKPSPVMVWTPEQTGRFLDHTESHRLRVMWRLIAFRGLRRGEGCGPRWVDHDYAGSSLAVATQLVQDGWEVIEGAPKTNSGIRVIALDKETNEDLKAHCEQQERERAEWGDAWVETGRIFTEENGTLLHPGKVTDLFERLVAEAGLPPIRLHDLRHGAATLMLAAGVDVKVVSETLGHSDTRITRDIYQAVLDDLAREAAEAVVQLVPRARGQRHLRAVPDQSTG